MKVLVISSSTLPAAPSGPAYVAAGHALRRPAPALRGPRLIDLVERLRARPGYTVQVNHTPSFLAAREKD